MTAPVTPHDALIFVMVMASAVDNSMNDRELRRIGQLIDILPIFEEPQVFGLTSKVHGFETESVGRPSFYSTWLVG